VKKQIYRYGVPVGAAEIVASTGLSAGNAAPDFEEGFRRMYGEEYHSHATYKGRTAIYLILKSLGLKEGDEVLIPSFVCETVIKAILRASLTPRLVDIDNKTFTIDPSSVRESITPKTRALIAVHTFGQPCDLKALGEITKDAGIYLIEDCAQALGAKYRDKPVGTFGDASMFSFHIDKVLSTGFGGMTLTKDLVIEAGIEKNLSLLAKCTFKDDLRVRKRFYEGVTHSTPGIYGLYKKVAYSGDRPYVPSVAEDGVIDEEDYIKKISSVSAAIGIPQIGRLQQILDARSRNANLLSKGLEGLSFLEKPGAVNDSAPSYLVYTVKVRGENPKEDRLKIIRALNESGIEALNYIWAFGLHEVPYYKKACSITDERFPGTQDAVKRIINIPVHPLIGEKDMQRIIEVIRCM